MIRTLQTAALLAGCLVLGGCYGQVQRTITIDSSPPGAAVWLNDNEVGRTPVTVPFTWYGTYGVRLECPGYEPLQTTARVRAPVYEWIPLDLPFETVVPGIRHDRHEFKFDLKKAEPADPEALQRRAEQFRAEAQQPAPKP